MYRKILYSFVIFSVLHASHANAGIPAAERQALISIYNQMSGVGWTKKEGWLGKSGTECGWFGVTCSNNAHVAKLDLSNNKLKGRLPSNIGLLSHLDELEFSENNISGTLKGIERLTQLKLLYLADNQFSGQIPPELAQLTKLEVLILSFNHFNGVIPKEIALLSHLKELNLDNNLLYGRLPQELGKLHNLEELRINKNQLTGMLPDEIKSLTKLNSFSFFDNCLTLLVDKGSYILPIANSVINLDIGDQNQCNGNQHDSLPITVMSENYDIYISSVNAFGQSYEVYLARYKNPLDKNGWYWSVEELNSFKTSVQNLAEGPVSYNEKTSTIVFNKMRLSRLTIKATLNRYYNPSDMNKAYFQYKL